MFGYSLSFNKLQACVQFTKKQLIYSKCFWCVLFDMKRRSANKLLVSSPDTTAYLSSVSPLPDVDDEERSDDIRSVSPVFLKKKRYNLFLA